MAQSLRFNPMLKFFSNPRVVDYFNGKDVFPINIELSLSGVCPANCRKCFYRVNGGKLKGLEPVFFDFDRIPSLISEFKEADVKSITWTGGGEPTTHPKFAEISEMVAQAGIQQGLFTNALIEPKYDPSLMEWIRITKTNHPFPSDNIKKLRGCRTIGLCINYAKGDEPFISEGIKLTEELDKMKFLENHSTYLQIRPEMNTLGELHECELPEVNHPLVEITEKHAITDYGRGYTDCEGYHFTPFVWQNGDVDVCAYHKEEKEFNLGNLYKESFLDIMKNAPRSVKVVPNCQACCKLHEMNIAIEQRKNLKDINFI